MIVRTGTSQLWARIHNAGRTNDGSLDVVDGQSVVAGRTAKDFESTFIFDFDGKLVRHTIDRVGANRVHFKRIEKLVAEERLELPTRGL